MIALIPRAMSDEQHTMRRNQTSAQKPPWCSPSLVFSLPCVLPRLCRGFLWVVLPLLLTFYALILLDVIPDSVIDKVYPRTKAPTTTDANSPSAAAASGSSQLCSGPTPPPPPPSPPMPSWSLPN